MEKLNLTQQKHAFTNQKELQQHKINTKKLKPGLVASYNIWPGNREDLFWFWHFINLSLAFLDTYTLTYSPRPTRDKVALQNGQEIHYNSKKKDIVSM